MTEEEAKTKWCPMARQMFNYGGTFNREVDGAAPTDCRCLASGCMMWRWDGWASDRRPTDGRCGLAGRDGV